MKTYDAFMYMGLLLGLGAASCNAELLVERKKTATKGSDAGVDAAVTLGAGGVSSPGAGGASSGGAGGNTGDASPMPAPSSEGGIGGAIPVIPDASHPPPEPDAAPQCRNGSDPPPPRWTGNGPECPATRPQENARCYPAGEICEYLRDSSQDGALFKCIPVSRERSVWYKRGWDAPFPTCPPTQPIDGTLCPSPLPDVDACPYANGVFCSCEVPKGPSDAGARTWYCAEISPAVIGPGRNVPWRQHPDTIDEARRISELTHRERQTWCEWYTCLPQEADSEELTTPGTGVPVGPDGYTRVGASTAASCTIMETYFTNSMLLSKRLSVEQCVANLSFSSCGATLFELDDCILTTMGYQPHPLGCGTYFDTEGCSETIIKKYFASPIVPDSGTYPTAPAYEGGTPPLDIVNNTCELRVR